ncbi:zinc transporter ZIP6 isoform X2 [Scophthalmus maximus]|nr:zinc transporter ZIP6 isoform X2 [Scophthalmus maximus]XP_047187931.1 zinc transporter ZIP6 isoform X2 [Scophthalmus maximus]XP_047187932.1 zinc transporter ZIP6 isoform X2 [Scophthalmus maximus]XP_047187933.1 zinc transporter ZIP6 isoform X2 [Scophthalmus maximus]
MTSEEKSGAALAVILLLAASLSSGDFSAASDCSPSATGTSGLVRLASAVVDVQRAEQSQKRHLEALFNRYGENGTISLDGLKRLLQSVGLDRIRTVMVQHHEQLGHRHHHHHHHHHHHDDHLPDNNNSHHQKHVHAEPSRPGKFPKSVENRDGKKTENPDSHHNLYDKKTPAAQEVGPTAVYSAQLVVKQGSSPGQSGAAGEGTTGAAAARPVADNQTRAAAAASRDDDDHIHDHIHDRVNGSSLESVECLNASSILSSHGMSQEVAVTLGDFRYLCPALLNQIDFGACLAHGDAADQGERDHKLHSHAHGHHGDHNHSYHDHSERNGGESDKNIATAWAGGFISITIISLLSLLGVVLIPLMNRVFFKFLLSFLVALAVGTLSGDAFLHLIPHSQGGHHHHHEDPGTNVEAHHHLHDEPGENLDGVWKGLTALSGVYFMFLIEHFLTLGKMYKDKNKKQKVQKKKWDQNHKADPEKQPALGDSDLKPPEDVETNGAGMLGDHSSLQAGSVAEEEQVMLAPQVSVRGSSDDAAAAYTDEDCENKCHSHFHDTVGQADSMHHHHHDYHHILHHHHSQNHHPHSHSHSYSEQHFQQAGVATLAWMVIMGDGLHNFSDGLAIGAAFTEGLSSGLSTSVAVFCHELPHELGDFAVLLKAGMTVRQAILYNVLSAMMAYLGMVTGILIGHYAENISMWIFALTAGLFMYVALVDMVPEMLHNDAGDHGFSHCGFFLLQNAGILLGFCIMLLIAIFEHKIQLDLGY